MKKTKLWVAVFAVFLGPVLLRTAAQNAPPGEKKPAAKRIAAVSGDDAVLRNRAARYVREKFSVPNTVKLTVSACKVSPNPQYLECTITADDGKQPKSQPISVSKDGRYLAMSGMYVVGPDTKKEIGRVVREVFKLAPEYGVTVGELQNSGLPGFEQTTVTAGEGEKKQQQTFFVSKDKRYLVLNFVYPLLEAREVVQSISTKNQPSQGPVGAPVTIVEYADLQCPTCARLHEFLENELIPKYPGKVRVVFKDFPLLAIHDWTQTASVASQCAYQIDPADFVAYRTLVFKNQAAINATNSRDMLLNLASQAGIDSLKLAGCVDARSSWPRVEEDLNEGKKIGVASTPTCYINGHLVVGATPDDYYKAVDAALRNGK